jgi:hypothetical protein
MVTILLKKLMSHISEEPNLFEKQASGITYNGEWIPLPKHQLAQEVQIQLLDWHPVFSGCCPICETPIATPDNSQSDWNCSHCDWNLPQSDNHIAL